MCLFLLEKFSIAKDVYGVLLGNKLDSKVSEEYETSSFGSNF